MKKLLFQLVTKLPYNQLERTSERGLFSKTPLFCTVSGGQDSILTLFVLLHTMFFPTNSRLSKEKKHETLQIVHCHHFWQKKNILTPRSLFQLSSVFNLPYTLLLPEQQFLTENSTRTWRRRLFCRVINLNQSVLLSTGHTQTDTLETKINHLFRGTSLKSINSSAAQKKLTGYFFSSLVFSTKTFQFQSMEKTKKRAVSLVLPNTRGGRHLKFLVSRTAENFEPNTIVLAKSRFSNSDNTMKSSFTPTPFLRVNNKKQHFMFKECMTQQTRHSFCSEESRNGKKFIFQPEPKRNFSVRGDFQKKLKNSSCFVFYSSSIFLVPRTWKPLQSHHRLTLSKIRNFYVLPVSTDRTNFSIKFSRNQVRHQLLPTLTLLVNKEMSSSFLHFFEILNKDAEVLENQASILYFLLNLLQHVSLMNSENVKYHFLKNQKISGQKVFRKGKDDINISKKLIKQNCQLSIQNLIVQKLYLKSKERELSFLHISTIQKDFLT